MIQLKSPCNNTNCAYYNTVGCGSTKSYEGKSCEKYFNPEDKRTKAHALVDAYFDGKDIIMKDPAMGVPNWTQAVNNQEFWSYLQEFCESVDKYKIVK